MVEDHYPPVDEGELSILLEDYIFNIPMNMAVHNMYDPSICAEVHRLRTIMSWLVGMKVAHAHL